MKIQLHKYSGIDVLSGSVSGQKMLASLVAEVGRPDTPITVFLDFSGIAIATASYLRECVLGFRDYCRQCDPVLYAVVANANETVLEELRMFLRERGDALWCCDLSKIGSVSNACVLGKSKLEVGQRAALELVCQRKTATAPELSKLDRQIGTTGWNNRLSGLAARLLIKERRQGRLKIFSPVVEVS